MVTTIAYCSHVEYSLMFESRADGLTKYKEDKVKPLYDGLTPKPHYVTEYYKKREEIAGVFSFEK